MGRIEARTRDFQDAAELEVVADDLGEEGSVGFGEVGARREVSDGYARFVGIHADRGAKPILSRRRLRADRERNKNREKTEAS